MGFLPHRTVTLLICRHFERLQKTRSSTWPILSTRSSTSETSLRSRGIPGNQQSRMQDTNARRGQSRDPVFIAGGLCIKEKNNQQQTRPPARPHLRAGQGRPGARPGSASLRGAARSGLLHSVACVFLKTSTHITSPSIHFLLSDTHYYLEA